MAASTVMSIDSSGRPSTLPAATDLQNEAGKVVGSPIRRFGCVINTDTAVTTGDLKYIFPIPKWVGDCKLVAVEACCGVASTSGDVTISVVRNNSGTQNDILSTNMTIQASEWSSANGTAGTINEDYDDLTAGTSRIEINVDAAGTGVKWIHVWLGVT